MKNQRWSEESNSSELSLNIYLPLTLTSNVWFYTDATPTENAWKYDHDL